MASDNIFQQWLQKPKSVLEYQADYDVADARKQTLKKNALELAAGQQTYDNSVRTNQENALVRAALGGLGANATDDDRVQAMRRTGTQAGFTAADALDKSLIDRKKGMAEVNKNEAETKKLQLAQMSALHGMQAQKLATVQSPEDALAWAQESHQLGMFPAPGQYDQGIAKIQAAAQSPEAFSQWKQAAMRGGMTVAEQFKQQLDELAQREKVRQFDATESRIRTENAADRGVTVRGQNMTDSRARDQLAQGRVPPGYRAKADGTMEAIPGGPAAGKVTDQQAKVADAQTVVDLLDLAEPLLDQSSQGLIAMGRDAVQAATGRSTPGAQAAAELRALEGALISKMPKMSGPQSDKDVLLYRQMAGQIGDPTIPAGTKRAAMKTIRNINQRYLSSAGAVQPAKPNLPQGWSVEVK